MLDEYLQNKMAIDYFYDRKKDEDSELELRIKMLEKEISLLEKRLALCERKMDTYCSQPKLSNHCAELSKKRKKN